MLVCFVYYTFPLGMTAVHRAAAVGNTSVLGILINFNPEVDLSIRICKNHLTPLHLAAAEGQTPMASFLAANGAKVKGFKCICNKHCTFQLFN